MVDESSSTQPVQFEQWKTSLVEALDHNRLEDAADLLARWMDSGQPVGEATDRMWLFQKYQACLEQLERFDEGLGQLERLNQVEPRDKAVALAYGNLLYAAGRTEDAVRVWRSLLIHHRGDLDSARISETYARMGEFYRHQGDTQRAGIAFDQALLFDSDNHTALKGMLLLAEDLDDPEQSFRTRQLILKRVRDDVAVAAVLQKQGDDLRYRKKDLQGSLRFYDDALNLVPGSPIILHSVAEVLKALGHVREAVEVYLELAKSPTGVSSAQKEEYLDLAWESLQTAETGGMLSVRVLDLILDMSPNRLELFEELTKNCREMGAWEELAAAYKKMIRRVRDHREIIGDRVLPLLYYNLGELLAVSLDRPDEAIECYLEACRLLPTDVELRRRVLELLGERPERLKDSLRIARELLDLVDDDPAIKKTFAELQLQAKRYDEAFCLLRVARTEGQFSDSLEQSYQRLGRTKFKLVEKPIDEQLIREYIRPADQQLFLNSAFAIGTVVFHRLFANDLSTFGVRERDRVNLDDEMLFNRLYKDIGRLLGVSNLPKVYIKRDLTGMTNAALDQPAFFVGPDMMSGKSDRELSFVIAQQFTLIKPEYQFAVLQEAVHLKTLLLVMTHHVEPSVQVHITAEVKPLKRQLDKRMKSELAEHLREVVGKIIQAGIKVDVKDWVESVIDTANRMGLVFCDDQEVADRSIALNPGVKGPANLVERTRRLHRWACSEAYFELRKALGLSMEGPSVALPAP